MNGILGVHNFVLKFIHTLDVFVEERVVVCQNLVDYAA